MTALQQGQADGMCGIYAVLNFLRGRRKHWGESANDSLWYLLNSCQQLGWLSAHCLTYGFEDYQLKAILELQIERYSMPFVCYFVRDVIRSCEVAGFDELSDRVQRRKGSIIAHHERRKHWVLMTHRAGEWAVIDSANRNNPVSELTCVRPYSDHWGIVILPRELVPLEIDL